MPVEIEAKMKVEDLSAVRARLAEVGAVSAGAVVEVNTFFDTEDRTLLASDRGLRVRTSRDPQTGAEEHIITYKGPRRHGPLKTREENEVTVANAKDAAELLNCLGFLTIVSFEKRRESWKLDGCKIELDEIPHLGTYVEIEGPREDAVMRAREKLALTDRPPVRASYVALLMSYLQERGITDPVVKFPK